MSDIVITCPKRSCAASLRLALDVAAKPLSCPHCRTAILVVLGSDGNLDRVERATASGWRVPGLLLVPGFALFILGVAGAFANGYLANRCWQDPAFSLDFARNRVSDLRSGGSLTGPANDAKKKSTEATPEDAFAAVAGPLAEESRKLLADEELAQHWQEYVLPVCASFAAVSVVMAIGGLCIVSGRFYTLAFLGSLAGIVNFNLMCCVPGAVAGIWGILMLVRDDGRKHFGLNPRK